jgi:hypothetical protein
MAVEGTRCWANGAGKMDGKMDMKKMPDHSGVKM